MKITNQSSMMRVLISKHSFLHWILSVFYIFPNLEGVKCSLVVILMHTSLTVGEAKHLFTHSFVLLPQLII